MKLFAYIKHYYRMLKYPAYKIRVMEKKYLNNLKKMPRYLEGNFILFGNEITYADAPSFVFMFEEIFKKEIYKFNSTHQTPYIIDAGANIGLSTIYFKHIYPNSEIVCFEPDKRIHNILCNNINSFKFENVKIFCNALWNDEVVLNFNSEGADAGRISDFDKNQNMVSAIKLRSFLNKKVDFLKIDIEGAEIIVLEDCKDLLINVERLFVEYHSFVNVPQSLDSLLNILFNAGFRYYIQSNSSSKNSPFLHVNEYLGMDLQLNIYAVKSHLISS